MHEGHNGVLKIILMVMFILGCHLFCIVFSFVEHKF